MFFTGIVRYAVSVVRLLRESQAVPTSSPGAGTVTVTGTILRSSAADLVPFAKAGPTISTALFEVSAAVTVPSLAPQVQLAVGPGGETSAESITGESTGAAASGTRPVRPVRLSVTLTMQP